MLTSLESRFFTRFCSWLGLAELNYDKREHFREELTGIKKSPLPERIVI